MSCVEGESPVSGELGFFFSMKCIYIKALFECVVLCVKVIVLQLNKWKPTLFVLYQNRD